jgi:hypothetical protein
MRGEYTDLEGSNGALNRVSSRAMKLVPEKSSIRIQTFAEGMFARVAHDLELVCRDVSGTCERTGSDAGTADVTVPIAKIDVGGTLKGGRLNPDGMSGFERRESLAKMRKDVFHSDGNASDVVRVHAVAEGGSARVRVVPPRGREVEKTVPIRVASEGESGVRVSGTFSLSLDAIGSAPVKGPMNAFRVKDAVELLFDVVFVEG